MWWPAIDDDIEKLAKTCEACMSVNNAPPGSPLSPWLWPRKPWQRLHIDFAGPLFGKMYFILIDTHSKWPEIWEMSSTSTNKTIEVLRHIFSVFGLPEQVVSDNGHQFSSFLRSNGIKHFKSAPYHPFMNGAAERLVQTFKKALKKGKKDGFSSQYTLSNLSLYSKLYHWKNPLRTNAKTTNTDSVGSS